jgi:hypothetical protein
MIKNIYFCNMKNISFLALFLCCVQPAWSQKGCKDPQASNYNALANENDGSCIYTSTNVNPVVTCPKLGDSLMETSGLIYFNNWLWTLNDGNNPPFIYAFDGSSGQIIHRTFIANAVNTDWEEMTQDSLNIYIGDFGNNNGNRKDLRILVIKKSELRTFQAMDTVNSTIIHFSMADQGNFANGNQNHDFDMEAMCVFGDSLHLFSKNWADKKTRHYVLPKDTGTYTLKPVETLNVNGQITGACADEKQGRIVLTGYNKSDISCFVWVMWDFKHNRFGNGNKRRLEIGSALSLGQNEALCFRGKELYISNEKYLTEAGLRHIDIEPFLTGRSVSAKAPAKQQIKFKAYQSQSLLLVQTGKDNLGKTLRIYNSDGKLLKSMPIDKTEMSINIDNLMEGVFMVEIDDTVQKIYIRQ